MKVRVVLKACLAVTVLGAVLTPPLPSYAATAPCPAPTIEVASRPGGQLHFKIQSPCRKGELVIGRYGEFVIMERFDAYGKMEFQLDCFLGNREFDLTFMDNWSAANRPCSAVEIALTKVAIVWQDHVDLDLHAFEYAASPGSDYDLSERNPGSYETAQSTYARSGRSHGFMSTVSDGQRLGHNVEVYTLVRHSAEPRGLIALAVGLGSHDDIAGHESCSNSQRNRLRVE